MSLLDSKRVLFSVAVMIFCFSSLSAQNEQNEEFSQEVAARVAADGLSHTPAHLVHPRETDSSNR